MLPPKTRQMALETAVSAGRLPNGLAGSEAARQAARVTSLEAARANSVDAAGAGGGSGGDADGLFLDAVKLSPEFEVSLLLLTFLDH